MFSELSHGEMRQILLLILGCAIQVSLYLHEYMKLAFLCFVRDTEDKLEKAIKYKFHSVF